jgi:peptidoglycan hydrolase-like protein with peptidoglycan-binding domain
MSYTNAQFRDILIGLGYISFAGDFRPPTNNNSPLTDPATRDSIRRFQQEYQLKDDGIAGSVTQDKARQVVTILQDELRTFLKINIPTGQPFYGPVTADAVRQAQNALFPNRQVNGIADRQFRQTLYNAIHNPGNPSGTQNNWRWCQKCYVLAFAGSTGGPGLCAAGGRHDHSNSANYLLKYNSSDPQTQSGWNWCQKCQCLWYSQAGNGPCPAGGVHDGTNSQNYSVMLYPSNPQDQSNWAWCRKCDGLFFAVNSYTGACPASGNHDSTGSQNYSLATT